ncbi:MAG TPA: aspartate 1-decarboxylase [Bryobacteraceae bacterium]|nr:aspartate 1-decarboxylase [Bryobacteraceae bacterium]
MLRKLLKCKIHRATLTSTELQYEGSISVDQRLLDAAGIVPYEAVHVWNINNGQRFETYALAAPEDSGQICLNGAAARLGQPGDKVIIATFCWLEDKAAGEYAPEIIAVDDVNRII